MNVVDFISDPGVIWTTFGTYSGDLAFDVGANGGMTSRIFAENFKRVVAFEPCRESYMGLLSDCPHNVVAVPCACADAPGVITLEYTDVLNSMGELKLGESMARIWGPTTGYRTVPAVTLDQMAQVFGYPDFVKIDTEGSEWLIVQGGVEVFARRPAFVIEVHAVAAGDAILDYLTPIYGTVELVRHPFYPPDPQGMWATHYYLTGGR